jgi:hypothetical protein
MSATRRIQYSGRKANFWLRSPSRNLHPGGSEFRRSPKHPMSRCLRPRFNGGRYGAIAEEPAGHDVPVVHSRRSARIAARTTWPLANVCAMVAAALGKRRGCRIVGLTGQRARPISRNGALTRSDACIPVRRPLCQTVSARASRSENRRLG